MTSNIIPSDLVTKLQQNNIIIFVGAGLSIAAGFPSWKKLIVNILQQLEEKEPKAKDYIEALNKNVLEPLEVLKKIYHLQTEVIEIFEKEFKKHKDVEPTKLHTKIGELSSRIITTNYDNLLEKAYPKFIKIVYTNEYQISKMSNYSEYIFKIHGDIEEPNKAILFPNQYKELYSNKDKCPIFELKKIFSDKSILFIGFSMSDPYINYLSNYINDLYSGFAPKHYLITPDNDNKNWNKNITPIIIDDYNNLEQLIDSLLIKKEEFFKSEIKNNSTEFSSEQDSMYDYSITLEYDTPPDIKYWVGRDRIIENISNENFKVICITGIGGQGKSALAAYYLKNKFDTTLYEFADWRDFKEETNRFQTKLISIIKRLSQEQFNMKTVEGLNNKQLTDIFFKFLGNRRIIFVFDNIDSYIDLENFIPSGDIGYFFDQTVTRNHNSKFIFTCRPFIREASINFYQISLPGLTIEETTELFNLYHISAPLNDITTFLHKAHATTNGHPLWLNIIAAQASRDINLANNFLKNIENKSSFVEENVSAILSQKILTQIWESLNSKQQNLLRGIAETVKPETIDDLKTILNSELNNNQFDKAFKTLRNLNLIEVKRSAISPDLIELHPLVKEFIISKYQRTERIKYIALFVKFYDSVIYILKPRLNQNLTLNDFLNWTSKIELQINKLDYESALIALQEISQYIIAAGYIEEYLRVSEKLFDSINWHTAIEREYPNFHSQLRKVIIKLTEFGRYSKADELLKNYEQLIPEKNSQFLSLCSMRCHFYWFQNNFEKAITFGEQGEFLLSQSGVSDDFSLLQHLALARRDSKNYDNIKKSLIYFLGNEKIENVTNIVSPINGTSDFYGNVGKCLELMNKPEQALICYFKSFSILLKEKTSDVHFLNIGYACYWISNLLINKEKILEALYFLKYAINSNESVSPPKAKMYRDFWDSILCDIETKKQINDKSSWQIEEYCKQKTDDFLKLE